MGSELACPCTNTPAETEGISKKANDQDKSLMQTRIEKEDIIFQFSYQTTKICVVRTLDLEKFFNTRSILKLTANKEVIFNIL